MSASVISVVAVIGTAFVKAFVDATSGAVVFNATGASMSRRHDARTIPFVTRGAFDAAKSQPGVAAAYAAAHEGASMPDDHVDIADLPAFAFMVSPRYNKDGSLKAEGRFEPWSLEDIIRFGPNSDETCEALWVKVDAWLTARENA